MGRAEAHSADRHGRCWHRNSSCASDWENPFVESFNARLRDELFNREIFHSVFEAKVLYFDWCDVYNNFRPHSSLGYLAPSMFAALLLGKLPALELQPR